MSRSDFEAVPMTRPVTIPGPGRHMGRAALLHRSRRHVRRAARQAQLTLALAPSKRNRTKRQNDDRLPTLQQGRTARRECSRNAKAPRLVPSNTLRPGGRDTLSAANLAVEYTFHALATMSRGEVTIGHRDAQYPTSRRRRLSSA